MGLKKMKYIRTKYGKKIIDVSKLKYVGEDENDYLFCKGYKNGKESKVVKCFTKKVITKVADTIEELCDEFVFNVENQGHLIINNYKRTLEIAKSGNEDKNKFICYGAIWTDKGLIYVAKMNDKGELELL